MEAGGRCLPRDSHSILQSQLMHFSSHSRGSAHQEDRQDLGLLLGLLLLLTAVLQGQQGTSQALSLGCHVPFVECLGDGERRAPQSLSLLD